MRTVLTRDPEEAAAFIKRGGIVAFPTETVYGLGANVFDETAVAKIFEAKRRPADNPLIAHIANPEQLGELAAAVPDHAKALIDAFFPGPLTVVLEKKPGVPLIATAGLETIGIRMPAFLLARQFLDACGTPVVAPSANLSGRPSPTTWGSVFEDLDGRVDCILQGKQTDIGLESTVVDCTGDAPIVLRIGSVSLEDIQAIAQEARLVWPSAAETARSPGLRHKHYSPKARVKIVENARLIPPAGPPEARGYIGIQRPDAAMALIRTCDSLEDYARSLFEFFRECDRRGVSEIYCEAVEETGIGAALMDRLRRAAE